MKLKEITFEDKNSVRIYRDYLNRVEKTIKVLDKENRQEILLEINSHIYEGMISDAEQTKPEADRLAGVLEKLGQPEAFLKSLVAEKKLEEATKTFNPMKVAKALALNMGNGFFYILFALLYLCLFGFVLLIVAKLISPDEVGLFYQPGKTFVLGMYRDSEGISLSGYEQLGNWFIPVMLVSATILYVLLTLGLRLKRTLKNKTR